jgi:2-polyprenyl-6-methoxyphenol hydroxylase-like FAD-dependent oxidoreductase
MRSPDPQVLVVGAGPTGLTLACARARAGVGVRIVDKSAGRSDRSKALGIHAGTLESLDDLGVTPRLIERGFPARRALLHTGRRQLAFDLTAIPSRYAFVLVLPQSETEAILEETAAALGIQVERQAELRALTIERGGAVASLQTPRGGETVRADYVVGCDGAHSAVRRLLGIPFAGGAYTGDFLLADVRLRWDWDLTSVRALLEPEGVIGFFPIDGRGAFRIVVLRRDATEKPPDLTLDELRQSLAATTRVPIAIETACWLTRFHVHHRIASRFRAGPCFLAGDAAHIHSPIGGQGMNTGIQDALALADLLTRVLIRGASPTILDRYERARMPVARGVLRGTDFVSRFAVFQTHPWLRWARDTALAAVSRFRFLQRLILRRVSQVRIARRALRARQVP